jgi:hypothetical protein
MDIWSASASDFNVEHRGILALAASPDDCSLALRGLQTLATCGASWTPMATLSASNSNKVKRRTGGTMDRNNQQLADMILDWRARNADKQ